MAEVLQQLVVMVIVAAHGSERALINLSGLRCFPPPNEVQRAFDC
jgi:hypothetical protein